MVLRESDETRLVLTFFGPSYSRHEYKSLNDEPVSKETELGIVTRLTFHILFFHVDYQNLFRSLTFVLRGHPLKSGAISVYPDRFDGPGSMVKDGRTGLKSRKNLVVIRGEYGVIES